MLVVVVGRTLVRTGYDQQCAVRLVHFVDADAHGQDVVVGMGVEGPILVPFHRAAVVGGLHVQLVAIGPNTVADQLRHDVEDPVVLDGAHVYVVVIDRALQAADLRIVRSVIGLEIVQVRVFVEGGGFFNEFVGHPLQIRDLGVRKHFINGQVTILMIKINLLLG